MLMMRRLQVRWATVLGICLAIFTMMVFVQKLATYMNHSGRNGIDYQEEKNLEKWFDEYNNISHDNKQKEKNPEKNKKANELAESEEYDDDISRETEAKEIQINRHEQENKLAEFFEEYNRKIAKNEENKKEKKDSITVGEQQMFNGKTVVWYLIQDDTELEEVKSCGPYECMFLTDTTDMEEADAIIVDGLLLSQTKNRITPKRRDPDQVWVYYSKEPWSQYSSEFPYGEWNSIFNWTFTYDKDSDFIVPGGEVVGTQENYFVSWNDIMKQKTKQVLWISNECKTDSRREVYVDELKKYINVDIMGDCGNPSCTDDTPCYMEYMFFLSFESTHCKDYVTDNFFKTFDHPIVPIVRGGANYSKLYPKSLYINTADFASPRQLAEHLHYLMKNTRAYMEYLKRRQKFSIMYRGNSHCLLCSHLYHLNIHRKAYTDLASWMGTCKKPTDLNFD